MNTMKIKGRGLGRKILIACDADGCIKEHLDQFRSENADVEIQAKCAPILIEDLKELFASVTRKIHDLGPRAVYSYNGDDNDKDGLARLPQLNLDCHKDQIF